MYFFKTYFIYFFGCAEPSMWTLVPAPGLNPCPLQWKGRFLTTWQSGRSPVVFRLTKAQQTPVSPPSVLPSSFSSHAHLCFQPYSFRFHPAHHHQVHFTTPQEPTGYPDSALASLAAFSRLPMFELVLVSWAVIAKYHMMGPYLDKRHLILVFLEARKS